LRVLERVVAGVTLTAGVVGGRSASPGSDATSLPALIASWAGGAAVLVLWAARVGLHLAITRRAPERRRVRRLVALPFGLLISVAFVSSGAAFWVRFMLSRSLLKAYVQTASPAITASSLTPGVRVGLFRLRNTEVLPQGVVRMITTECGVVDSAARCTVQRYTPVLGEIPTTLGRPLVPLVSQVLGPVG
jgi:hypothetical protein